MLELGALQPGDIIDYEIDKKGFTYALLSDAPQSGDDSRFIPPMRGQFYDIVPFWSADPTLRKVYRVSLPAEKEMQFQFYQGSCESMVLPVKDGVYGVQAGHSPVLVAIHMGMLKFTVDGETREILVGDGIAEVTPTFVLLLVDSAERPEDIDKNRAEAARIRAEERLQHKQSMHEYYQTKIALDRAMQRLQTAAKYKR